MFSPLPEAFRPGTSGRAAGSASATPARPDVLADDLACRRDDVRAHLGRLPRAPFPDGRVVLVGRATVTDSVLAGGDGFRQPVVLTDRGGGPDGVGRLVREAGGGRHRRRARASAGPSDT
ncbi:hypothetical protein [Streptomyces sp. NPDC048385]|uniref:hypothetical protein n=1 Tax=unclassified Streptomyces TaxID=2593676 RepID=UPI00343ECA8D